MKHADRQVARLLIAVAMFTLPTSAFGQANRENYIVGEDQRLQMMVHVLGEVENPGEYLVPDDTNVLELISKAGGPTEFSNVSSVIIKRVPGSKPPLGSMRFDDAGRQIVKVDIKKYLSSEDAGELPRLRPGDVVAVPRNGMHRWKTVFSMVRDVSVVASAYFLYLRAVAD